MHEYLLIFFEPGIECVELSNSDTLQGTLQIVSYHTEQFRIMPKSNVENDLILRFARDSEVPRGQIFSDKTICRIFIMQPTRWKRDDFKVLKQLG